MIKKFLLTIVLCLTIAMPVWANPRLVWDANDAGELVVGYKILAGTVSGVYGEPIDVGNVTEMVLDETIYSLGGIYYFVCVAYDGSGNESDKSDECVWDRMAASNPENLYVEGGILKWTASTSTDVAGYKAYFGSTSGVYEGSEDVGNVVEWDPESVITSDGTYYFTVSSYDNSPDKNESGKSGEVSIVKDTTSPAAPTMLEYVPPSIVN